MAHDLPIPSALPFNGDSDGESLLLGVAVAVPGLALRLCFDQMFVGSPALLFWILVAVAIGAGKSGEPIPQ